MNCLVLAVVTLEKLASASREHRRASSRVTLPCNALEVATCALGLAVAPLRFFACRHARRAYTTV
jgi:hypothetical protein